MCRASSAARARSRRRCRGCWRAARGTGEGAAWHFTRWDFPRSWASARSAGRSGGPRSSRWRTGSRSATRPGRNRAGAMTRGWACGASTISAHWSPSSRRARGSWTGFAGRTGRTTSPARLRRRSVTRTRWSGPAMAWPRRFSSSRAMSPARRPSGASSRNRWRARCALGCRVTNR